MNAEALKSCKYVPLPFSSALSVPPKKDPARSPGRGVNIGQQERDQRIERQRS
ncbi:hypothetical protein HBI56_170890 [Parastagonospora nodorum]|uniref:Uncharacterized protein n=1 Tax=Phaeosphaeria nodorum (strain SN15 / ATCC MYA-4574 / FGSC 10173) TaxID=321614 RepID=A0A7U2F226_PHANO|nr:hypothetical protein HBH56_233710 [Parastagonospora nodorum]QRC97026.1 hypothetical protein JI435_409980 [Parastagonospora nodorum SN15]KAH3921311.1 hypothetical protein HBH54_241770 [Parastagonospora nodorum]KAH3944615.1 hypothetical protein HBH53_158480 [Parastagonospora nodorum]KAH3959347.1 hypothetical protein HBH52_245280 [Parastagonospora nodorum]